MELSGIPTNPRKFLTTKFNITGFFLIRNVTDLLSFRITKFETWDINFYEVATLN